jgi:hypothetical protein
MQIDFFNESSSGGSDDKADFEKTSLKRSVDFFLQSFLKDLNKTIKKQVKDHHDQNAANNFDF